MAAYTTISLPKALHGHLTSFLERHPELGYGSVAEFAKEAIRLRIEEMREEAQQVALGKLRKARTPDWRTRWERYRGSARQ
ncbi:MAG: hypothetical protein R6U10_03945 [Thermoplasmatota archaeon]